MAVVEAKTRTIPNPEPTTGLRALHAIYKQRNVLAAMQVFHRETGDIFRIQVPGFSPIVMAGPEACHFVLVEARHDLRWRMESDPITNLLIHGVLVEDDDSHDQIRRNLNPALHKRMMSGYIAAMVRRTDQVTQAWTDAEPVDMLVEMRKVALLILMDALFDTDYTPHMADLWDAVLYLIKYISPGLWLFWGGIPRPGYRRARAQMDAYLLRIIRLRREELAQDSRERTDMLSILIQAGMQDDLIRDQLMTMLIAGHDTSTASLSWALYLLGQHPDVMAQAQHEIDNSLGDAPPNPENTRELTYLTQVINETLRLYPPIHLGSRIANRDLIFDRYRIPAESRVLYSIYLTHRHADLWPDPDSFDPDRFAPGTERDPYTFLPFGGGPRNCIGMVFAQVETRIVLARILQQFNLHKRGGNVHIHMGATLEPRPGVMIQPQGRNR